MPVLPGLQVLLDAVNAAPPPPGGQTVAEARDNAHAMMAMSFGATQDDGPPVREQHDHRVAVAGGEITVRVYVPDGEGPFPCHVYFHGGGFWLGNLDMSDASCRATAVGAGCVVASVDYRLAPEAKFPVPAEDCFTALTWVVDHAADLGIDPSRVSVGGVRRGAVGAGVGRAPARPDLQPAGRHVLRQGLGRELTR